MNEKTIYDDAYKLLIVWLIDKRKELNLNQEEFAKMLGITQTKLSRIESRARRLDIIELWHMCKKLEMDFVSISGKLNSILEGLNSEK